MQTVIQYFVILPIIGFIISVLLPRKNESLISKLSIYLVGNTFYQRRTFCRLLAIQWSSNY
jgi:hypothetical protein